MSKVVAYQDDDLLVEISVTNDVPFMHISPINKPTPSKLKRLKEVVREVCAYLDALPFSLLFGEVENKRLINYLFDGRCKEHGEHGSRLLMSLDLEEFIYGYGPTIHLRSNSGSRC